VLDDYPSFEKLPEYCEALELAAAFIREIHLNVNQAPAIE
jgi:hypothetical protein